jgi:sugar fermentation stimulation protein A
MRVPGPILEAEFLRRLNRFAAEVVVEGRRGRAHLPNPSKLTELFKPGARILVTTAPRENRKTAYTIFGVYDGDLLVGIDSRFPNLLFAEAVEAGRLAEFSGYHISKREVRFGNARFDFLLERPGDRALVEVKSCSLVLDGVALFPDVPTERGLRHILKLIDAVRAGYRAYVVWVVQRPDAKYLRPYREVHPEIEDALREALGSGVQLLAYTARLSGSEMQLTGRIPVKVQSGAEARKAARFLHEALGLDPEIATVYTDLLVRGSMSRGEVEAQAAGGVRSLLQLGMVIVDPSDQERLMPIHPRLAVTNIVRMLRLNPPRGDVERAVALLTGLYSGSERAHE